MKRVTFLILAVALLISALISACGQPDEPDAENTRDIDTARSFVHTYTQVRSAEAEDTIYFIGKTSRYIKYVDKETGISGVLCGKPECTHSNTACNAYVNVRAEGLFVDGDRLYWIDGGVSSLYSAALDGTDRQVVRELERGLLPNNLSDPIYTMHNGYLFYSCTRTPIEDGVQKEYAYVCAFPLDPDKQAFVILNEEKDDVYKIYMQPYGDDLYILTNDFLESEELLQKGLYLYNVTLQRWSSVTGELETLYVMESRPIYNVIEMWVDEDGVLFCGYDSDLEEIWIYKYSFETGECAGLFPIWFEYPYAYMIGIADGIVTTYSLANNEGVYDIRFVIKDFNGATLVDETYEFDLSGVAEKYRINDMGTMGRDETYAYYSLWEGSSAWIDRSVPMTTTVIAVALDGSGARVLCTEVEELS